MANYDDFRSLIAAINENMVPSTERIGDPCPRCGAKLEGLQNRSDEPIFITCVACDQREYGDDE